MKNMIELPGKGDFYRTKNVEITQDEFTGIKKIHYRDCNIAMRSITDFTSIKTEYTVSDEEKMPEYEKAMDKFNEKVKELQERSKIVGPIFEHVDRPIVPMKKVSIIGTVITYFNGTARIIVDDFEEFEYIYFDYLTKQKLDILKSN